MPLNKNAIIRYQTLDKCFSNPGRRFHIADLLEACNEALAEENPGSGGIQKRQLYDDIRFMESAQGWSVPLERQKEGRKTFFRYSDPDFSINKQPLNEQEAEQLKSAMMVLARFKGLPQFEWISELIPKLDQTFKLSSQKQNIVGFDNNEFLQGLEHISPLFNAILNQQCLKIDYQSFRDKSPSQLVFHPYYLKEYNNRWFVFGKTEGYNYVSNLALDRVQHIGQADLAFVPNTEIDFDEYFEDIIGVTKPQETPLEKITLQVSTGLAPYIKTKPLHGSQRKVEENEKGYCFSIEVIPNYELEKTILSFGEDIQVVSPKKFRNKIRERLQRSLENP